MSTINLSSSLYLSSVNSITKNTKENSNLIFYPIYDKTGNNKSSITIYGEKYHKISSVKNIYNKLNPRDFSSKKKYNNFTLFAKRELELSKTKSIARNSSQFRQRSALPLKSKMQLNKYNNSIYLTETLIKNNNSRVRNRSSIPFNCQEEEKIEKKSTIKNYNIPSISNKNLNQRKINKNCFLQNNQKYSYNYLLNRKCDYMALSKKKENSLQNYIKGLNEYMKNKYVNKYKEEKILFMKEEKDNKNHFLDNKINYIKELEYLFNRVFFNKYTKYIKFLEEQIELEIIYKYQLMNDIYHLKKQIAKLDMEIRKKKDEKHFYKTFIYLQICVKEKKLLNDLPPHYKYIIDHNNLKNCIDYYKGTIPEEEIKRIYNYKTNIIYKDYNDYCSQIKQYEDETKEKIIASNEINAEVNRLERHNQKYREESEEFINYYNKRLLFAENEKSHIIQKNLSLQEEKEKILKELKNKNKNTSDKKINKKKNFGRNKNKNIHIHKCSRLLLKVKKLRFLLKDYIKNDDDNKNNKKEEIITDENVIIIKLLKEIEEGINLFMKKNAYYNKKYTKKIKKINYKIEKEHKREKGIIQMELLKKKYINLKNKIEKKSNKIYFLTKRKIRAVSAPPINKKQRKKDEHFVQDENIEDYIYYEDDDEKMYYNYYA